MLSAEERAAIEGGLSQLVTAVGGEDADAIHAAVRALEVSCEFYVERRMNAGIRRAMAGHKVEDFE